MTGEDATPGKDRSWASGNSEGEESRMHTEQSRMVRASLEATAHPDVYARRKVAAKVRDVASERVAIIDGATPFDAMAVGDAAAQVVVDSDLRAPVAEVEGDHDDLDPCTCPTTQRDGDGNCDLLEQDDCPVHGAAEAANVFPDDAERVVGEVFQSFGTHVLGLPPDATLDDVKAVLPDSADTRLQGIELNAEARERGPSIVDGAHPVTEEAYMANLGRRREGWRGRLAHVELLLREEIEAEAHGWRIEQALAEVRALIDEG